jgi:hypothetical protein
MYLFSWNEIPGNDSWRLTDFLKSNYDVDWVKTAEIAKIDNIKTIMITAGKNSLSLNLNNENTELNLIIDNGKPDKFIVKTENGKLNIYANITKDNINKVILVGGPTRMPIVQNFIEDYFGKKVEEGVDPMECVAMGAAILAGVL